MAVLLIVLVSMGLAANPKDSDKNSAFLNINNTTSEAKQREQVIIRRADSTAVIFSGEWFGSFLENTSK